MPKKIIPKRLVLECSDEFHAEVKRCSRRYDFISTQAFIMWALQDAVAKVKQRYENSDNKKEQ